MIGLKQNLLAHGRFSLGDSVHLLEAESSSIVRAQEGGFHAQSLIQELQCLSSFAGQPKLTGLFTQRNCLLVIADARRQTRLILKKAKIGSLFSIGNGSNGLLPTTPSMSVLWHPWPKGWDL